MLHQDTITLFNRYESKLGDKWYATVIHGVHVRMDKAAIQAKYGAESADAVTVMVPCQRERPAILIGGYRIRVDDPGVLIDEDGFSGRYQIADKAWLPPKEWDAQTNDELPDTVTFTSGNGHDFFMVGEWDGDTVIDDESYITAKDSGFYSYMSRTHDFVFAITSVGGPYRLIPHFELTGK